MKKKLAIVIIAIIALSLTLYLIQPKNNKDELTLYGNVEIRQVDLGFRVGGQIQKMFYEEGDYVKKGDLLAQLDDTSYRAEYEKSVAAVKQSDATSKFAQSEYERNIPLCRDNTTSKLDCDNLNTRMTETAAQLDNAVQQSVAAKDNLYHTKIYAPNDGTITTRVQEEGAVVNVSSPVYTLTLTNPVWIRAYIPETALGNIKYGMKAMVLTDSVDPKTGKKKEYTGWVGYISPVAEFTPKTVQTTDLRTDLVYRIRVYIYNYDKYLRQGMPTTVKINLHEAEVKDLEP